MLSSTGIMIRSGRRASGQPCRSRPCAGTGRGTQLQPGIDLLERAEDFPKDAPILLITDGQCEHLHLHGRTHAYLLPKGRSLPFVAKGEVFWLDESSLTRMIYVPNKSAIS